MSRYYIDSEIAHAWTLPALLYTDSSVFAEEKEKIFAETWQVVGHASQVCNPGDYFTTELVGEPLVYGPKPVFIAKAVTPLW